MSGVVQPERRAFRPSSDAGNLELNIVSTLEHELPELEEDIARTERTLEHKRELLDLKRTLLSSAQAVVRCRDQYRKEVADGYRAEQP